MQRGELKLLMHFDNNQPMIQVNFTTVLLRLQTARIEPNFPQIQNLVHTHIKSDGYNVYHNIKCSHDDGFDAITLKKEWQIDFWLNLLDDGEILHLILRKNRYDNNQTSKVQNR